MRDHFVFAVAPYVVAFAFLPVCAVRYVLWRARRHRETPAGPARGATARPGTAGALALAVVLLGHVFAFVFPEYLQQWNRQLVRLLALEASGAIAAVVAILGLGVSAIGAARARHRDARAPADIVARALAFTTILSGLGTAVLYRWASIWAAVTLAPYLHSLAGFDPRISLVTFMPPLVKLHVASAFALVAILPFTKMALRAMVWIDGLARRTLAPLGTLGAAGRAAIAARGEASLDVLRTKVPLDNGDVARGTRRDVALAAALFIGTVLTAVALVYPAASAGGELRNRIPEPAPYVTAETGYAAPPFEEYWATTNHPARCQACHKEIFDEWKGSMMANAWRDPAWRAAFLLSARQISTHGNCDTPAPPDGTAKAQHNPFAVGDQCVSRFDLGDTRQRLSRSGSLVDGLCSRCHMPTNYIDNVPLHNVTTDGATGEEHGMLEVSFNPTSDAATGLAFATVESRFRNTDSGKAGVACMVCHSLVETRNTPFHNFARSRTNSGYPAASGPQSRAQLFKDGQPDIVDVPDRTASTLGYAVGSGGYRLSPHAIVFPERFGPLLSPQRPAEPDPYLTGVFKRPGEAEPMASPKHEGYRHVLSTRGELCSTCHDVTNPLTIKNVLGKWVGGFPIERTYSEWATSRYADRPGNANFDPAFKRDCQTCHMQQDYGRPGTAQTLYREGRPVPPLSGPIATDGPARIYFSHHFVGGNAYIPRLVGASLDEAANIGPYPELSTFSFSSADEKSVYHNAYWVNADRRGAVVQQARLAWDRLRNVLDVKLAGPATARAGASAPISVSVANTGSGHNFPTGFPEGRIAWLAVSAIDLATGRELPIHDTFWNRTSLGVGRLTTEDLLDPAFPRCGWKLPSGSPDPYAYQFKAVATRGDECPTLELVYAMARNLVTNAKGLPTDRRGMVIDKNNPLGEPIFRDLNGNGDLYDDSFLSDTRLRPMPHAGATAVLDRYSVVIPPGTHGPVAISAAVYYQSLEAIVARKFLGNLADTNANGVLEPCVLGGRCDGRRPSTEPPVVEGAPPVPMEVRNWVVRIEGETPSTTAPDMATTYPPAGATDVPVDVVAKVSFTEPVMRVDAGTFTLVDSSGTPVPAAVDQIGDGTWGLFPDRVFLNPGETYTAKVSAGVCGVAATCTTQPVVWKFTVASRRGEGTGDTTIPAGYRARDPRTEKTRMGGHR